MISYWAAPGAGEPREVPLGEFLLVRGGAVGIEGLHGFPALEEPERTSIGEVLRVPVLDATRVGQAALGHPGQALDHLVAVLGLEAQDAAYSQHWFGSPCARASSRIGTW